MSAESSQDLKIELKTHGRNTIPIIKLGNIITIHGKNGVGKSMAATLLEIASGNYIFENETKFQRLAKVIDSCEIDFKIDGILIGKAILKPYLWRFDKNVNRVSTLTLGKYYKGKEEIDFEEFRKIFCIRSIRGNESLHQQILFFKDIFVAKIDDKLKKLESKINCLDKYKDWLDENDIINKVENYQKFQENYNEQLNRRNNLENSISNRKANEEILGKKSNLVQKLILISENDKATLIKKIESVKMRIEDTKNAIELYYRDLSNTEQKKKEWETKIDETTKTKMKNLNKLRKKKESLNSQLDSRSETNLENLGSTKQLAELNDGITHSNEKIKEYKKNVEKLNKENERIIEINKFITQLRDITSKANSQDFGKEKLITAVIDKKKEVIFSFQELFEIFQNNNFRFKQDDKLKEYQQKVQIYNDKIEKNRDLLKILTEYNKNLRDIAELEKELKGSISDLDSFIDPDSRLDNLKKKAKDQRDIIEKLKKDQIEFMQNFENYNKILKELEEIPSQISILNNLKKLGLKIPHNELKIDRYSLEFSKIEKEMKQNQFEITKLSGEIELSGKEIKKLKDDIENNKQLIKLTAKNFGYTQTGEFIAYLKPHVEKFEKYYEYTNLLYKRLGILKNDTIKVIEGGKPKTKMHLDIINNQFDEIFRELYGRKEFFEYVFKDYSKIKRFDISNKTIVFETSEGLEETRDLEEFSSGEKTYAYCRSIISMTANIAKYNIVILDESYALLDHEHSQNLYQFQEEMVKKNKITKFINILPLKENLNELITLININIKEKKTKDDLKEFNILKSQLEILQSFKADVDSTGYYQEIHYPYENRKVLKVNYGITQSHNQIGIEEDLVEDELSFSFILDGSNIARNNPNSKNASIRDVVRCKKKLQKLGVPAGNILIIFGAGLRHYIPARDKELYEDLLRERTINQAPAGRDDDWFIIQYAKEHNSYIITNDRYLDYSEKSPEYKQFLKSHSIRYTLIRNDLIFEEGFKDKLQSIMAKS